MHVIILTAGARQHVALMSAIDWLAVFSGAPTPVCLVAVALPDGEQLVVAGWIGAPCQELQGDVCFVVG